MSHVALDVAGALVTAAVLWCVRRVAAVATEVRSALADLASAAKTAQAREAEAAIMGEANSHALIAATADIRATSIRLEHALARLNPR